MAYKKHPRQITNEQFSEGTTIDGSRIDSAMGDVVDYANSVPPLSVGRRFVQTQYVAGWRPWSRADRSLANIAIYNQHNMPWLPTLNYPPTVAAAANTTFTGSVVSLETPPNEIRNHHRFKGTEVPGILADVSDADAFDWDAVSSLQGMQWAWSRTFYFSSPAIVTDIAIGLHTDRGVAAGRPYQNTFTYDGGAATAEPPDGFKRGDTSEDLVVLLDIAHPFTPEDTSKRSVVVLSRGFGCLGSRFSRLDLPDLSTVVGSLYNDITPPFTGGSDNDSQETIDGLFHRLHELNVPIPAKSRVRLAVVIPQHDSALVESSWGANDPTGPVYPAENPYMDPWASQSYSATLTVLEELFDV